MAEENVISVKDVVKVYNRLNKKTRTTALKGVSFDIKKGRIFGFLGPNGSGKTTVIKIILGIIPQTSGEVTVFGSSPMSRINKKNIGYLPERLYYPDFTDAVKLLQFYGSLYDMKKREMSERIEKILSLVGLGDRKNTKLREYSKGMLQRFGLAQALLHDPGLYIFDEPASGLDPAGQRMVRDIMIKLREEGKTVFFSSHQLSEAEMVCNDVAIVNKGELVTCGALQNLLVTESGLDLSRHYIIMFELKEGLSIENLKEDKLLEKLSFEGKEPIKVTVKSNDEANKILIALREKGCNILAMDLKKRSLEELFLEKVGVS